MVKREASIGGNFEAVSLAGGDWICGENSPTNVLYLGTGGDLVVLGKGDTADVTFVGLQAGYHLLDVQAIRQTGTTASDIVVIR